MLFIIRALSVRGFVLSNRSFSRGLIRKLQPVDAARPPCPAAQTSSSSSSGKLPEVSSPAGCAWNTSEASPSDDVAELLAVPSDEAHLLTLIIQR